MTAPRHASEHAEQATLFECFGRHKHLYPELALAYAIPNGGKRELIQAARLKAEGVRPGVPDICLPVSRNGWHGLYIELKVGSNKLSDHQHHWILALVGQGYMARVAYGWEAAWQTVQSYLKGEM